MFIRMGKRFNIHIPLIENGVHYPNCIDPGVQSQLNIMEITDPVRLSDKFYYITETDESPFVINTPKNIDYVRQLLWSEIKDKRDFIIENGGCFVHNKWFHSDVKSKQQQMALTLLGANLPASLQWKTMDGSFITITQQVVSDLFMAQVIREQLVFAYAETLKVNMDSMTFEELVVLDINAGWPTSYSI